MRKVYLFLIIGLSFIFLNCRNTEHKDSIEEYEINEDSAEIASITNDRQNISSELLDGTWLSNNSPITMTFKNGHYYDYIETDSEFIYRISSDSLIIDNIDWGRQTFRILKLSDDTLKIQLIRQEIFEDNLNEEVYDDEERVYWRYRS